MATLERTIEQLNRITDAGIKARATMDRLTEAMSRNPSRAAYNNIRDELNVIIALEEKRIALTKQANSLSSARKAVSQPLAALSGRSTGTTIPTGDARVITDAGSKIVAEDNANAMSAAQRAKQLRIQKLEAMERERQAYIKSAANAKEMADMAKLGYTDPQTQFKYNRNVPGGAYSNSLWQRTDPESGKQYRTNARIDQMGNVTQGAIPKVNQSFTQGIGKDIGDLLKWSIAIGAIYGPINAASEAIAQLVENEAKLADVSVKMSSGVAGTTKVFDDIYVAAQKSGEGVSGIIDAFGAAFTAAGRISDPVERYTSAVSLLDDSLALSKLSTLDQAGAIDTLTAALYQVGDATADPAEKLARGRELIDQWILVSNSASVSVETLATGVAVLGDSAETSGLRIEQLNSMIAVLSEVSLSSGKETANIAKALIGNYQQESAVKELNRLGIAVVDTSGKTRQFLDVMKDVSNLRVAGILNDQDFGRLTLALGGGGIRRQKDVAAFIENFSRMEQLTKIQDAGAGGQTELAMAKKLDTVQTSATKLQSSIVNLAQTMGNEGGLLETFSTVLTLGTGVADVFNKIAEAVGKVGPLLLAAGLSSFMLGQGGLAGATNKLATNITNPLMSRMGFGGIAPGMGLASTLTGQQSIFAGSKGYGGYGAGMNFGAKMTTLPTLAAIALPAISNFRSGDKEEGTANLVGGAIGAAAGAAFGAAPIGALVGSAIAEAFVRTTLTYDKSFAGMFAGIVPPPKPGGEDDTKKPLSEEVLDAYRALGEGDPDKGAWAAKIEQLVQVNRAALGTSGEKITAKSLWTGLSRSTKTLFGTEAAVGEYGTTDAAMMALLKTKNPKEYARQQALRAEAGIAEEGKKLAQTQRQIKISTPEQVDQLLKMQQGMADKLKAGVISGDIKQSDYANRIAALSAFTTTSTGWMASMQDASGNLEGSFKTTGEAWQAFLEIIGSGNQEAINNINSLTSAQSKLEEQILAFDKNTKVDITTAGGQIINTNDIDVMQRVLADIKDVKNATIVSSAQTALGDEVRRNLPAVSGGNTIPRQKSELNTIEQRYQKTFDALYSDLTETQRAALIAGFEPFKVLVEEAGKVFYTTITGKDMALWNEMLQQLQQENKISNTSGSVAGTGLDFMEMDITRAQLEKYVPRAQNLTRQLEGKGYKSNVEDVLVATSDNQITKQHVDMKILQYLLGQILDTEKKQLQGVWNLPEGASFWVPLQSMIGGKDEGKGGKGKLDPSIFAPDATATEGYDWKSSVKETIEKEFPTFTMKKKDPWELYGERREPATPLTTNMDDYYLRHPTEKPGIMAEPKSPYTGGTDLISQLFNKLSTLIGVIPGGKLGGFTGVGQGIGAGAISGSGGGGGNKALQYEHMLREYQSPARDTAVAPIANKIDIKFSSTTQLSVDGRVLATIIKPYLASDLVNTNQASGGITRAYVI